jgi:rubredoxin
MPNTVFINFKGGIISPGNLFNIMAAAQAIKVGYVRFGLRQQLLIDMEAYKVPLFAKEMEKLNIAYEVDTSCYPNIISSYPAADIFIRNTWLSEGVYKDILESIAYQPTVKVNICDSNQSFTPLLTGNINWVASLSATHYWHLIVRFPKTNVIYEWSQLCYTNDINKLTKAVEQIIRSHPQKFVDNKQADGDLLFSFLDTSDSITKPAEQPAVLPQFNLPYYEGLNRYDNRYWLGIYRRDEMFSVAFLKKLSKLCLDTRIGQICCTSWKTIMIKGIAEKDRAVWNALLEEFQINMRHAANELNFQVEDHSDEGIALKNFLVKHLSIDDTRTFGICIGIKTRKKSEVFSNIMVRRRHLINFLGIKLFRVYDILCTKDFNPNERTGEIFSSNNPKFLLPEQLYRSVLKYYRYRAGVNNQINKKNSAVAVQEQDKTADEMVSQCTACLSVYDASIGDIENGILPGTSFERLQDDYVCPLCDNSKAGFKYIKKSTLGV